MDKKKQLEFDLSQVVRNIEACDKNITIFQAEVEKQKTQRIDLEILKRELEAELKKLQQ